jgi:hypothetical protein
MSVTPPDFWASAASSRPRTTDAISPIRCVHTLALARGRRLKSSRNWITASSAGATNGAAPRPGSMHTGSGELPQCRIHNVAEVEGAKSDRILRRGQGDGVPQALLCQWRRGWVDWLDHIHIGAPGEQNRQIEQDNPGKQTQSQIEGEAPAPASAGKRLSVPRRDSPRASGCRYDAVLFDLLTALLDSRTLWNRGAGCEKRGGEPKLCRGG